MLYEEYRKKLAELAELSHLLLTALTTERLPAGLSSSSSTAACNKQQVTTH
jgi:hypothetical protein